MRLNFCSHCKRGIGKSSHGLCAVCASAVLLIGFHESLNVAIRQWANMVQTLMEAENYRAADALISIQPDARKIDLAASPHRYGR